MDTSEELFACPSCGAKFSYKPPPGRQVLCTCGHAFLPNQNIYDVIADDEPAPVRPARRPPPAPAVEPDAVPAAAAIPDAGALADAVVVYARRPRRRMAVVDDEPAPSRIRDRVAPALLLSAGAILWLTRVAASPPANMTRGAAVMLAVCQMILTIALALAGGALSLRFVETSIGAPGRALLKMSSIAVFSAAVAVLVVSMDRQHFYGAVIAVFLVFLLYPMLLWVLFRLEMQETLLTSAIILVLQIGGTVLALKI